jgi:gamma-glutamylcyclotransferase (GGCT)/AIG2-like uncharacterized protein YtfP
LSKGKIIKGIDIPFSRKILLIFMALSIPIIVYYHIIGSPFTREGEDIERKLRDFNANQIAKIEVCESYACSNYLIGDIVNAHKSKQIFAQAIKDLSEYHSNHDYPIQKFYIRMYSVSGDLFEFDVYLKSSSEKIAYLNLVQQYEVNGSMHLANLGGRKSKIMYNWLDYNNLIRNSGDTIHNY